MTAKEHYEKHLGSFYSWMTGDFQQNVESAHKLFQKFQIQDGKDQVAFDLGCGHGIQSAALLNIGFRVIAVDFNQQLLNELHQKVSSPKLQSELDEIVHFLETTPLKANVISCMGDTLTHLTSIAQVKQFIRLASDRLIPEGKLVLSFRDLTSELTREHRFIPVKQDEHRLLTCFLEYFPSHVIVHDILWERENSAWKQRISSYPKLRISAGEVGTLIESAGLRVAVSETINRMEYLVAEKVIR